MSRGESDEELIVLSSWLPNSAAFSIPRTPHKSRKLASASRRYLLRATRSAYPMTTS